MSNTTSKRDLKHSEDTKKHNTAITSREAFKAVNESGQRLREKVKVLDAIRENQPVTSRMVSCITGIERTNITCSLFDLVNDGPPLVKVGYIDKCPETKKRVKWYTLIEWPQIQLFTA
jgi:predicted HTH transcriptional regulator